MSYSVQNIRNVCLLGHSGSGKTALAESLLYITGAIDRMGRCADGNTVCDYDPEETKRQISLSTAVAPLEYKGCRINVLDTPGAFDFAGEVMEALRAADAAIIVCSAKDGVSVGLEKAWKYCEERNMPRFIYISKTDEDNSDYNATFEALRERFGKKIAPIVVPIWDEDKRVTGIIDVLNKRAYEMQDLKRVEIEIPEGKGEVIEEFNNALKESVAETSEEFMDKFFGGEDFTYAEMIQGLRQGVRELSLFPVLCGSAVNCMGSLMLMDNIVDGQYRTVLYDKDTMEPMIIRASDAVLLSLVGDIPLYIESGLMLRQSVPYNENSRGVSLPVNTISDEMLQAALDKAIADENYELASHLRDEKKRRNKRNEKTDN